MEKIPSLFVEKHQINPLCEWVTEGKGKATVMHDGFCYAVIHQMPYRHCVTPSPREGFIPCCFYNRQWWGWEPVPKDDPIFWPVWEQKYDGHHWDWSYELVNGVLIPHGREIILSLTAPSLIPIAAYLSTRPEVEGVVWWEDINDLNCRKAKVQRPDLSLGVHHVPSRRVRVPQSTSDSASGT